MTTVAYTVGNTVQVRDMPWLDALAFYFHVQSEYMDLFSWPITFGVDREDEVFIFITMSYYPEAHVIEK